MTLEYSYTSQTTVKYTENEYSARGYRTTFINTFQARRMKPQYVHLTPALRHYSMFYYPENASFRGRQCSLSDFPVS